MTPEESIKAGREGVALQKTLSCGETVRSEATNSSAQTVSTNSNAMRLIC